MKKSMIAIIAILGSGVIFNTVSRSAQRPVSGSGWSLLGPEGGCIVSMARNPKSSGELFALTQKGVVFRSTNNGGTWVRKSALDSNFYYYDIALDPKNSKTIYVLGQEALQKSVDGGATFIKLPLGDNRSAINGSIAIHPQNPKTIFISGSAAYGTSSRKWCLAVFQSTNGGQTWAQKTLETTSASAAGRDIIISVKNPSKMYFCGHSTEASRTSARVYRSSNGGAGWTNVTPAFMNSGSFNHAYAAAVDPTNPARVYVSYDSGVAVSANSGASWLRQAKPESFFGLQTVTIDIANPKILYSAGSKTLYKSADGGKNWTLSSGGFSGNATKILVSGKTLHLASLAGVFKSSDAGASFQTSQAGISATDISDFRILGSSSPASGASASTAYAAVVNAGIFKSANGGETWTPASPFAGSDVVTGLAVSNADPKRIYASTFGGVFGSVDGGNAFSQIIDTPA